jgi:hypothetical protein
MTTLRYDDIPTVEPGSPAFRAAALPVRRGSITSPGASASPVGRRGVLLGMLAVGSGVALSLLGALPPARPRAAYADHTTYPSHSDCAGRDWNPAPGGSTGCCACGSYIGKEFCAGNHWHRHDVIAYQGYAYQYFIRDTSCAGKNAWHWTRSGQKWRCSDGKYVVSKGSQVSPPINSVCPWPV